MSSVLRFGGSFTPITNDQWPQPSAQNEVSSRPSSATEPTEQSTDIDAFDQMLGNLQQIRQNLNPPRSDTPIPNTMEIQAAKEKHKVSFALPPELVLGFTFNSSVCEKALSALAKMKTNVGSLSEFELREQGFSDEEIRQRKVYRMMPISEGVRAFFDRNIGILERDICRLSTKYANPQTEESFREDFDRVQTRMIQFQPFAMISKQVEETGYKGVKFLDLTGEELPELFDSDASHEQKLDEAALIADFYDSYIESVLDPLRVFLGTSLAMKIQVKNASVYTLSAQKI